MATVAAAVVIVTSASVCVIFGRIAMGTVFRAMRGRTAQRPHESPDA